MLPKTKRLTVAQFNQFFSSGRRFHAPLLTICYTPHPVFHASVVVGKKVSKKAVERNKLRRRVYSLLYSLHQKHVVSGVYIILTKPAARSASTQELKDDLEKILKKIESVPNPR